MSSIDITTSILRTILSFVLIFSFCTKISDISQIQQKISVSVPRVLASYISYFITIIELSIAVSLLSEHHFRQAALSALLLLIMYTGFVMMNYFQGGTSKCACFGLYNQEVGQKISHSLIRNFFLVIFAIIIISYGTVPQKIFGEDLVNMMVQHLEVILLGIVFFIVSCILLIKDRFDFLARNMSDLNLIRSKSLNQNVSVPGSTADVSKIWSVPVLGLAPNYKLTDTKGETKFLYEIFDDRRNSVVVHISHGCTACKVVLAYIKEWYSQDPSNRFKLILVAEVKLQTLQDMAGAWGTLNHFLYAPLKSADLSGISTYPACYCVSPSRKVVSELAKGPVEVKSLLLHFQNDCDNVWSRGAAKRMPEMVVLD